MGVCVDSSIYLVFHPGGYTPLPQASSPSASHKPLPGLFTQPTPRAPKTCGVRGKIWSTFWRKEGQRLTSPRLSYDQKLKPLGFMAYVTVCKWAGWGCAWIQGSYLSQGHTLGHPVCLPPRWLWSRPRLWKSSGPPFPPQAASSLTKLQELTLACSFGPDLGHAPIFN